MSAATQNEMDRLKKERDAAVEQVTYWRERAVSAEGREKTMRDEITMLQDIFRDEYGKREASDDELARVCKERDDLAALCQEAAVVLERTANDTLDGRNIAEELRRQARGGEHEHSN